jgi:ADP-ribose pyrophosphatase YjhB (NUDIX family)
MVVINAIRDDRLGRQDQVLLVRRKKFPFANYWCLPGGFTNPHESVEESAARELNEETGLPVDAGLFRQLKVYLPDDPRADLRYRASNEDRQADELVERGSYLANIDGIRAHAKELRNHWVYDVALYVKGPLFPDVYGADDALEAVWVPLEEARRTRLAFHHNQILEDYVKAIGR